MEHRDLIKPLNEKEKEQLSRLETQSEKGEELSPDQGEALAELWQRQNRPADLEAFRARYESKYFGEWEGEHVNLERVKVYNYPAKVKSYEQKRQYRTTPQSLRELIKTERDEQPELKLKAIRSANLKGDPDEMQIKFDLIERVYEDYEQFLRQEIEKLNPSFSAALALPEHKPMPFPAQEPILNVSESTTANKKQPSTLNPSPPPLQGDFSIYIKAEYQAQLVSFLKEQYTNAKTKQIVCMLYALSDLEALTIELPKVNQTDLHKALQHCFGAVGTRQAMNTRIIAFSNASQSEHQEIQVHREQIKLHLEQE